MVEWPSSETERTFDQSAANGRKEPSLLNFYCAAKVCFGNQVHTCVDQSKRCIKRCRYISLLALTQLHNCMPSSTRRQVRNLVRTFCKSFEISLSKSFHGRLPQNVMEPVAKTRPPPG